MTGEPRHGTIPRTVGASPLSLHHGAHSHAETLLLPRGGGCLGACAITGFDLRMRGASKRSARGRRNAHGTAIERRTRRPDPVGTCDGDGFQPVRRPLPNTQPDRGLFAATARALRASDDELSAAASCRCHGRLAPYAVVKGAPCRRTAPHHPPLLPSRLSPASHARAPAPHARVCGAGHPGP